MSPLSVVMSTRIIAFPPPDQAYPLIVMKPSSSTLTVAPVDGVQIADVTGIFCIAGAFVKSTVSQSVLGP